VCVHAYVCMCVCVSLYPYVGVVVCAHMWYQGVDAIFATEAALIHPCADRLYGPSTVLTRGEGQGREQVRCGRPWTHGAQTHIPL